MVQVSVISIAAGQDDFLPLQESLNRQTFHDIEFIGEVGSRTPEFWNRAIGRSTGQILVFMDPDATPVYDDWLENLVAGITNKRTIVKGPEVLSMPLNTSSLAGYRQAFIKHPFDENYKWSEDTELFCQLKRDGYHFIQLNLAPLIHLGKPGSKTFLRRAFRYGLYYARIRHHYPDSVELMGISMALKIIIQAVLNLLGRMVGLVIFRPEIHTSTFK